VKRGLAQVERFEPPGARGLRTEHWLESGDKKRRFLIYSPPMRQADRLLPVVLDLHGSTSNPAEEMLLTGFDALADSEQLIVVAPEALGGAWNVPFDPAGADDVAFIEHLLDHVMATLPVDPRRVYATGFSGGARLACLLACVLSDRLAAVAAVGGLRDPSARQARRAVPLIAFHGTADPINPYAGGGEAYWQTGVESALEGWRRRHGCDAFRRRQVSGTVERWSCAYESEERVVFFQMDGLGHQWPGSRMDIGPEFGPYSREVSATEQIWAFFRNQALPEPRWLSASSNA
jgi:polyhydroxybutyrate depolymerase